ncbi:MAG: hypothetical protein JWN31_1334, partial [Frankiales bacterium]|nr:hypothetical protein [Frankiales bacterium]
LAVSSSLVGLTVEQLAALVPG